MADAETLERIRPLRLGGPSKEEQELDVLAMMGRAEAEKILADLDAYLHDELKREGSFWDFIRSYRTFPAAYRAVGKQHSEVPPKFRLPRVT